MSDSGRPVQVTLFAALLLACGLFMLWLGTMASVYFVPGACLLLQAFLLWKGYAPKFFARLLAFNQVTAVLLLLLLLTGVADALHLPKLNISGVLLLANLLSGGPLMGILAIPLLMSLQVGTALPNWFQSRAPALQLTPSSPRHAGSRA